MMGRQENEYKHTHKKKMQMIFFCLNSLLSSIAKCSCSCTRRIFFCKQQKKKIFAECVTIVFTDFYGF